MDDRDEIIQLRSENAALRERVRWLEKVCIPALRSIEQMTGELANQIEATTLG